VTSACIVASGAPPRPTPASCRRTAARKWRTGRAQPSLLTSDSLDLRYGLRGKHPLPQSGRRR
jgi:hypothetical protein